MRLDEFVQTTLEQIVAGTKAAQAKVTESGGMVNPTVRASQGREIGTNGSLTQEITFDVAVTVSETGGSAAGLRVGWAGIGAGLEGSSTKEHAAVSRIKFQIPLVLPASGR